MKIGYTGGTFDLFHAGHVEFLRRCKFFCDDLVVSLNTDAFAAKYKRPTVYSLAERFVLLSACRYVDSVTINEGGEDSRPAIIKSAASMIFHGDDWKGASLNAQLGLTDVWLELNGIEMIYIPYTKGISTTKTRERITDQELSRDSLST